MQQFKIIVSMAQQANEKEPLPYLLFPYYSVHTISSTAVINTSTTNLKRMPVSVLVFMHISELILS